MDIDLGASQIAWVIPSAVIQQSFECSPHTAPCPLPPALLIPVTLPFSNMNVNIEALAPQILLFTLKALEIPTIGPTTYFIFMFLVADKS